MTQNHHIGQQIRELRTLLGISARQLAQRIGISDSYIFLIEHGRPPTDIQIQKIENALGFKLSDPRVSQLFTLLASLRGLNGRSGPDEVARRGQRPDAPDV